MSPSPRPVVGDELPRLVIESVDAEKMKTMAALLADSNPIHWDVDTVKELGMGNQPVNQGPNNLGYVMNMLGDWAGGAERIQKIRVRFLDNVFAGDRLEPAARSPRWTMAATSNATSGWHATAPIRCWPELQPCQWAR